MLIFGEKCFKKPINVLRAFNNEEVVAAFEAIENYKKNHYVVGYVRYEAKEIFLGNKTQTTAPILYFEVHDFFETFTPQKCSPHYLDVIPSVSFEKYKNAFAKIKEQISVGNTYEVNFTFPLQIKFEGDDFELYKYLRTKQNTKYSAYIKNEYDTVLSFSPELFFEEKNKHIITKPMKGTIKRGATVAEDEEMKSFLQNDTKNRAENVMTVDLLRNDLGRISKAGSVNVTKIFEIETHKTLHQMTSQIESDLREDVTSYDIFKSLFPCGSITGAPKISTMKIIDKLETCPRNIYCGAIGFFSPQKTLFSVPIRILQKSTKDKNFKYHSGSAIVWDSDAAGEYKEALLKAKFLSDDFKLIETMLAKNGEIEYLQEHIDRITNSAKHYGFNIPDFNFDTPKNGIVRLALSRDGHLEIQYKKLNKPASYTAKISQMTIDSNNDFLYHKTTYRPYYNVNYQKYYDEIFLNERGEVTEGSRTNIVIEKDKKKFTPPVRCGLLNGIERARMIQNGECDEKILYAEDLKTADAIYCVNSVRGIKKVNLA